MGLEKKQFGIKDVIYLVSIIFTFSSMYYAIDNRITILEKDKATLTTQVQENGKLIKTIYLGLIASGAISPPSQ